MLRVLIGGFYMDARGRFGVFFGGSQEGLRWL